MSSNHKYDVAKIKHDLNDWKYILLPVNNLLEWTHKFDPFIIISLDTFVFGLLTYYDPSIVTTISIIGLACLFFESVIPLIANYVFNKHEWDPVSDAKYTRICERIANFCAHTVNLKNRILLARKQKTTLYFFVVLFFLIFCAYLGQNVDNSLLTYVAVVMLTLTPGARKNRIFNKLGDRIRKALGMSSGSGVNSRLGTQSISKTK